MGTSDSIVSLAMLAGLAYGAYYLISNNMIPGISLPAAATTVTNATTTTAAGTPTQEGYLPTDPYQYPTTSTEGITPYEQSFYYPGAQEQQPSIIPAQYPPGIQPVVSPTTTYYPTYQQQQYPTTSLAGPPGSVSSIQYMQTPSGPPYVSPTVNTYSQYSPYNQFYQYEQKWTPSWGVGGTWPDDNTNFTDIRTDSTQCQYCKNRCRARPYGSTCRACRMSCKKTTYQNIPAKQYWDIGVPGSYTYTPYGSYLAQVWDTIAGKPTFLEMDNYRQSKRFDPHNRLKRKIHPSQRMNHEFVTREDYWDNPTRINFNLE